MRSFMLILVLVSVGLGYVVSYPHQDIVSVFPLEHYDQTLSTWIKPSDPQYDKPLLTAKAQHDRFLAFYRHYVGEASPWHQPYVNRVLQDDVITQEKNIIAEFSKGGNGENFRSYSPAWIKAIATNMHVAKLQGVTYHATHRAITIDNVAARLLPTQDVFFYNNHIAGEGYPFDNLQQSALWAGTPVYIVAETQDHDWNLVIAPDYLAWVKSKSLAHVSPAFVKHWTQIAKKHVAAITHTPTSLTDKQGRFLLSAYIGSFFPAVLHKNHMELMIPVADANQYAVIKPASVKFSNASVMPMLATPHHFATLLTTQLGRPYGWGNLYFYNDCSAELKNLFVPFGIWLPRHSHEQVAVGRVVDMGSATKEKRLAYLLDHGHPFMTIIYLDGHIVMYIGRYPNPNQKNHAMMAMTYQNIWGLRPHPSTRRAVIGKAVLFPMLLSYPEDKSLESLAAEKNFQLSYLDQEANDSSMT